MMSKDDKTEIIRNRKTGITSRLSDSPAIKITTCEKTRGNLPIRPSLEVTLLHDADLDDVFVADVTRSVNMSTAASESMSGHTVLGKEKAVSEDGRDHESRGKLESIRSLLRELSPKVRRRRRKLRQPLSTSELSIPESVNISKELYDSGDECSYFSETETLSKKYNRRSLDSCLEDGDQPQLTHKTGLMSSVKNLFSSSKAADNATSPKAEKTRKISTLPLHGHKHVRQNSDSLLLEINDRLELQTQPQMRRATMDSGSDARSRWKAIKFRKQQKPVIMIDSSDMDCEDPVCLISVTLILLNNVEFEVQRLELSEVAAGISRLKHAESSEYITQTDEQSTLSRIEKLFPHDDLELNSSLDKKPRRRRSAPSQMLLKNLYRRSATVGGELAISKISQDSTASAPEITLTSTDYVSRKFIFESAVQLSAGVQTQHRYLFLFNDLLFIAKQRSSTSYKLKKRVIVSDIWISDYVPGVSEVGNIDTSKSFAIGWPTANHIATFTTKELCDRWKEKLKFQINEEQARDMFPSTTVEVVHKNAQLERVSMNLTLDRHADGKDLLQMTLQAFDVQNAKETDYQLWVLSTKDDSIYPLFGHEQPFAIQLSHERDAEEMDSSIKCQFILRENKKQLKLERKTQKSGKRKKLPLSNLFGRKSSGKLPSSPRSNSMSEGKIFGHPLDEICDPDIPTPLMELLENLYNHGPFTTEIFRKPSNAKRCQEMVNLMNSTEPEGWCKGCHNGILFASILKTFLRDLPGKLCCSEYYNQWSNAINLSSDADKKHAIERIIERMPKGNQLVLRYIVCILSHVQQRSGSNLMTSYNLAVCLGPSLLWNESSEKSEQEASSKTVPQLVQFLIDNCQSVFGDEILNMFGHPPLEPLDSDTEDLTSDRLLTPYNDSLESLSDTEGARVMGGGLTQMSPSSCSRDSGLILSDPHEGEQSDDHSLRQEIIKSKSCDSLSQPEHRNLRTTLAPLQMQVSSDSLDCDDEYIELGSDYNFLLTKSRSGGHLCFDKEVEKPSRSAQIASNERLRSRLASVASRYSAEIPSKSQDVEYSSSDSDKSATSSQKKEWSELHKSSTNSSLQQGSSSSDDAPGLDVVTHRHINSPRILESENGHHPRDFLQQFTNKLQNEESHKKKIRDLMRQKTEPILPVPNTDTDEDDNNPQSRRQASPATRTTSTHRHLKHANSTGRGSPRITRTNTYGGRSDRRQRTADVNMVANMAETRPIMPQQYRPNRPPPYKEAVERKEKMRFGVSEMERIKQTVNSARAKQLYAQSLQLFEQQGVNEPSHHSSSKSTVAIALSPPHSSVSSSPRYSKAALLSMHNNNTIGIVQTNEKKFVIKRAASTKHPADYGTNPIFYQPSSGGQNAVKAPLSSSNSFANSFYRPTEPPPYKEVMKTRTSKPDLIDSLGGESLV